jgi:hypothetical protein
MVSLTDLRARNVVPTWQEGVAVVQELLHTLAAQGPVDRLPDMRHVALIANGEVVALPGNPSGDHPVRHLARMLQMLLEGASAPPQLEQFVAANLTNPPEIASVEEFSAQLAFFERPGRRTDVEQLVSRAMSTDAQFRAEEELRRLKTKAAEAAEQPKPEQAQAAPTARRRRRARHGAAVAVMAMAAFAVAVGAWWAADSVTLTLLSPAGVQGGDRAADDAPGEAAIAGGRSSSGKDDRRATQAASPRARATGVRASGGGDIGARGRRQLHTRSAQASPGGASPQSSRSRSTEGIATASPSRNASSAAVSTQSTARPAAAGATSPQVRMEVTTPAVTGEPPMSVATSTEVGTIVYTAGDEGVMPALLLRPLLPAEPPPDVPPSQIGTLELVVNEQGDVERVRLISPMNRFHERMLVAHAKTWKFRPALRDGRPVKYRTVVRLTI